MVLQELRKIGGIPQDAINLLAQLLRTEPQDRLGTRAVNGKTPGGVKDILKHSFFQGAFLPSGGGLAQLEALVPKQVKNDLKAYKTEQLDEVLEYNDLTLDNFQAKPQGKSTQQKNLQHNIQDQKNLQYEYRSQNRDDNQSSSQSSSSSSSQSSGPRQIQPRIQPQMIIQHQIPSQQNGNGQNYHGMLGPPIQHSNAVSSDGDNSQNQGYYFQNQYGQEENGHEDEEYYSQNQNQYGQEDGQQDGQENEEDEDDYY
jgi:hypothetical protein